jgi:hypothetical protein
MGDIKFKLKKNTDKAFQEVTLYFLLLVLQCVGAQINAPTTEVWYVFHGTSLCEIDHKIIVIVLLMKITLLLRLRMQETAFLSQL